MRPQLTIVYLPGNPGSLAVHGEIDICTVPDLADCMRRVIQAALVGSVIMVDLSAVSFTDARGLAALVEAEAYACVRGIRLAFADIPVGITRLLTITHLGLPGPATS